MMRARRANCCGVVSYQLFQRLALLGQNGHRVGGQ
jgi:hypothetical protein